MTESEAGTQIKTATDLHLLSASVSLEGRRGGGSSSFRRLLLEDRGVKTKGETRRRGGTKARRDRTNTESGGSAAVGEKPTSLEE